MGQIVRKLSAAAGRGLRERLESAEFAFRDEANTAWSAKGHDVSVTLYRTGKLLVQGKGTDDFACTYLETADEFAARVDGEMTAAASASAGAPAAKMVRVAHVGDPRDRVTEPVCGSDETGKGDYFGPLVVAAFVVTPDDAAILRELGARDSKETGDREAMKIADQIEAAWPGRGEVVSIGPEKYNELHTQFGGNLNRLLAWAHATAIAAVVARTPCRRAVVDKFADDSLVRNAVAKKGLEIVLEQRTRAESHPAVAAASILARARFLRDLKRLGETFGTPLHKGAGSPVDAVARQIYRQHGLPGLAKVAKMHFKTTEKAKR